MEEKLNKLQALVETAKQDANNEMKFWSVPNHQEIAADISKAHRPGLWDCWEMVKANPDTFIPMQIELTNEVIDLREFVCLLVEKHLYAAVSEHVSKGISD